MGWLFETKDDRIKNNLVSKIGEMNRHIRNIMSRMDLDGGITPNNIRTIGNKLILMNQLQDELQSLINQLSPAKIENIVVPWIDGRNIPFYMWNRSFQMVGLQIHSDIETFENKYGYSL